MNTFKSSLFECEEGIQPQTHAKYLDRQLGFRVPKIENKLLQKYRAYYKSEDDSNDKKHYLGTQTWVGLHPQALQTPYCDILKVLSILKDYQIEKIVDIGAGYGRVGIVMNSIFPNASFIGYEILRQRQIEGNRVFEKLNLENCEMHLQNVLDKDFVLPHAQLYFIYDFSEIDDICQILDQLSDKLMHDDFFLISKGDRIDYLMAKKYKEFWRANSFIECGELKIYSSTQNLRTLSK